MLGTKVSNLNFKRCQNKITIRLEEISKISGGTRNEPALVSSHSAPTTTNAITPKQTKTPPSTRHSPATYPKTWHSPAYSPTFAESYETISEPDGF
mmetsp:Transcript_12055/g.23426  ORF Transcript_12055/g.23426 Transcript_12055/m.23426 type:complete len:96 (-) Transcript_12055:191-478(-)